MEPPDIPAAEAIDAVNLAATADAAPADAAPVDGALVAALVASGGVNLMLVTGASSQEFVGLGFVCVGMGGVCVAWGFGDFGWREWEDGVGINGKLFCSIWPFCSKLGRPIFGPNLSQSTSGRWASGPSYRGDASVAKEFRQFTCRKLHGDAMSTRLETSLGSSETSLGEDES